MIEKAAEEEWPSRWSKMCSQTKLPRIMIRHESASVPQLPIFNYADKNSKPVFQPLELSRVHNKVTKNATL